MDNQKIVSVYIKMGMDKASTEKAIAEFEKLQVELQALEKDAKKLKAALAAATANSAENVGELDAQLKLVEATMREVKKKADGVFSNMGKGAGEAAKAFNMRDIGEKLEQVGGTLTNAGAGIQTPLTA